MTQREIGTKVGKNERKRNYCRLIQQDFRYFVREYLGILQCYFYQFRQKNRANLTMQKYDIKTFQGMILALQDYWAQQGCTIVQPLDMEVGAGTSHPMTCLRALGPEPIATAYVQPSRRPTDGRYGENPNRLQHYYQFQVIIKPSPDNIQELYLGSLRVLGVDPCVHDIRFVEDNWENQP